MKILVTGASGSGTSTLGKALSQHLGVNYFDSDDYFWLNTDEPFTKRRRPDLRNQLIKSDIGAYESWVIGGSVYDWGEDVFPDFDLIVFLYLPTAQRLERLKKREEEKYGIEELAQPKRQKHFLAFLTWAADYDEAKGIAKITLKAHEEWLSTGSKTVLAIKGEIELQTAIKLVLNKITELNIKHEKI